MCWQLSNHTKHQINMLGNFGYFPKKNLNKTLQKESH